MGGHGKSKTTCMCKMYITRTTYIMPGYHTELNILKDGEAVLHMFASIHHQAWYCFQQTGCLKYHMLFFCLLVYPYITLILQIQLACLLTYLFTGNIKSSNMTPNDQLTTVRTLMYSHMWSCEVTNQSMHHSWNNACSSEQGSTEFQEEKRKLHRICQDK